MWTVLIAVDAGWHDRKIDPQQFGNIPAKAAFSNAVGHSAAESTRPIQTFQATRFADATLQPGKCAEVQEREK
jgi:hypothetical protein